MTVRVIAGSTRNPHMKTYKSNVDKLVYSESIHSINDAIAREKQLKN